MNTIVAPSSPDAPPTLPNIPVAQYWCETKLKSLHQKLTWRIENVTTIPHESDTIFQSVPFLISADAFLPIQWHILIAPAGYTEDGIDYVSVYLKMESRISRTVMVKCKMSIINVDGKPVNRKGIDAVEPQTFRPVQTSNVWGFPMFISRPELQKRSAELMPNSWFTVECDMVMFTGPTTNKWGTTKLAPKMSIPKCTLHQDLDKLFEQNCRFIGDVTFTVAAGKTIRAHKDVLIARSRTFAAIFEHKCNSKLVELADVQYDAFKEILLFIYVGKSPNLKSFTNDLLVLANRVSL